MPKCCTLSPCTPPLAPKYLLELKIATIQPIKVIFHSFFFFSFPFILHHTPKILTAVILALTTSSNSNLNTITNSNQSKGTRITFSRNNKDSLVTAITAKSSVQLVDIVSTRMLGQYGFLGYSNYLSLLYSHTYAYIYIKK